MIQKRLYKFILYFAFFVVQNAVAQVVKPNPVIIMLGNKQLTVEEFLQFVKRNQSDTLSLKDGLKVYADEFIKHKLKVAAAERLGKDTTSTFRSEVAAYRRLTAEPYLSDKNILENLIKETYERLKEEVNVSHILFAITPDAKPADTLETYREAIRVRDRAMKGEDFTALAKGYSDDPNILKDNGDLGWFTALKQVYPIEAAAYTTEKGEISMPVRTKFGYHLVKVNDRRSAKGKFRLAHILIKSSKKSSPEDQEKAKQNIDNVAELLKKGENFEKLAFQYSEDLTSKNNGGSLGKTYFSLSDLMPEFAEKIADLKKGEYSEPFKTVYGWHIVKLVDKKDMLPLAEMTNYIKLKIQADPSRKNVGRMVLLKRLKKENNFIEYQSVIDEAIGKFYLTREENLMNKYLFTINQKQGLVKEFYAFLDKKKLKTPSEETLRGLYTEFAENSIIAFEEVNLELKYPDFRADMQDYREGILVSQMMESNVFERSVRDSLGMKAFYEKNTARYQMPERLKGTLIVAENRAVLSQVMNLFNSPPYKLNRPFADMVFEPNVAALSKKQEDGLRQLLITMVKNGDYQIEIAGNSDPAENDTLSAARAKNIAKYLMKNNIPMTRIIEKDNGKFKPISRANRGLNSRVGFTFFSNSKQDVAKQYNNLKPESLTVLEGFFKKGANKFLDEARWEIGKQTFEKSGKAIYVEVQSVDKARPKDFVEASASVVRDYQTALEKIWIDKLKKDFPVQINEEELKKAIK